MARSLAQKIRRIWRYAIGREPLLALAEVLTPMLPPGCFVFRKLYFFVLAAPPDGRRAAVPGRDSFTVERGGPAEIPGLIECHHATDAEGARATFQAFLDQGAELWVARSEGRVVGAVWRFPSPYLIPFEDGYSGYVAALALAPDCVFLGTWYVAESFRRRGVLRIIIDRVRREYSGAAIYSGCDATNEVSLKAHARLGFLRCGQIVFVRVRRSAGCILRLPPTPPARCGLRRGLRQEVGTIYRTQ